MAITALRPMLRLRIMALALGCSPGWRRGRGRPRTPSLPAAAEKAQPACWIETLKEMVLIESGGSRQVDGLLKMAALVEASPQGAGRRDQRRKATAGAGADIVLVSSRERKIMLQAHMDVGSMSWASSTGQPAKIDGNRLYGPGIADDKGGLAVILAARSRSDAGWRDYDTAHRARQSRRGGGARWARAN